MQNRQVVKKSIGEFEKKSRNRGGKEMPIKKSNGIKMPKKAQESDLPKDWHLRLSGKNAATAIGVEPCRLIQLISEGLPRNPDKSYNLPQVIAWRMDRLKEQCSPNALKDQKLQAEIALKEAQLQRFQESMIDRAEHERILCARASAWKAFWPQVVRKNAHLFVGQNSIESVMHLMIEIGKQSMNAWTGGK